MCTKHFLIKEIAKMKTPTSTFKKRETPTLLTILAHIFKENVFFFKGEGKHFYIPNMI